MQLNVFRWSEQYSDVGAIAALKDGLKLLDKCALPRPETDYIVYPTRYFHMGMLRERDAPPLHLAASSIWET